MFYLNFLFFTQINLQMKFGTFASIKLLLLTSADRFFGKNYNFISTLFYIDNVTIEHTKEKKCDLIKTVLVMVFTLTRVSKNILSISTHFNINIIATRFVIYFGWKRRIEPRENKSTHIHREEKGHQIVSCERNIHTTMASNDNKYALNGMYAYSTGVRLCALYIFNCHLNLFSFV